MDYPTESYTNLAKQARRIEEVMARTQTPVEQVASVEACHKDSRLDTLCSELNELKVLLLGQANPEQPEDVNAPHLHNLPLGGRLLRSVFLVDLLLILKGTAAVLLLSGAEGVTMAVSTAAALLVEEEPKDLLPVLIVEVRVMWPVSVPRHV